MRQICEDQLHSLDQFVMKEGTVEKEQISIIGNQYVPNNGYSFRNIFSYQQFLPQIYSMDLLNAVEGQVEENENILNKERFNMNETKFNDDYFFNIAKNFEVMNSNSKKNYLPYTSYLNSSNVEHVLKHTPYVKNDKIITSNRISIFKIEKISRKEECKQQGKFSKKTPKRKSSKVSYLYDIINKSNMNSLNKQNLNPQDNLYSHTIPSEDLLKQQISPQERKKKIKKYLIKKSKRNFNKKTIYKVRKIIAEKRIRLNGRFVTKKEENHLNKQKFKMKK